VAFNRASRTEDAKTIAPAGGFLWLESGILGWSNAIHRKPALVVLALQHRERF
jgi:hypothetical protein